MLRELTIDGYRALRHFEMGALGRINLLVGTNDGGKTSVLEAINLLASTGDRRPLAEILRRRSEMLRNEENDEMQPDVRHLFHGHDLGPGSSLTISARNDERRESLKVEVLEEKTMVERMGAEAVFRPAGEPRADIQPPLYLVMQWSGADLSAAISNPLVSGGVLGPAFCLTRARFPEKDGRAIRFVSTASLSVAEVVSLFGQIVLLPEENLLVDALKIIDPTLERLAAVAGYLGEDRPGRWWYGERGGLFAKLSGSDQRIPIGSMGEGIWRLLGLGLGLVSARGGILLVDEIDTGLHFSVMTDMWRLVSATANRLGVQVFAATHSRDCVESLAAIAQTSLPESGGVSIQRIERGQQRAVAFTEREIVIAAERGIEIRVVSPA